MSKNFTHLEVHYTRVDLLNKSICFLFNDDIGSFSFKAADFKYPVMSRIHFLVSFIVVILVLMHIFLTASSATRAS